MKKSILIFSMILFGLMKSFDSSGAGVAFTDFSWSSTNNMVGGTSTWTISYTTITAWPTDCKNAHSLFYFDAAPTRCNYSNISVSITVDGNVFTAYNWRYIYGYFLAQGIYPNCTPGPGSHVVVTISGIQNVTAGTSNVGFIGTITAGNVNWDYAPGTNSITILNPVPPDPTLITASVNPICNGFSTQLTAAGVDGTVYWYTGSCGTTGYFSSSNPVTVSPTTTTTYYARNYKNSQYSTGCASLEVTVNQPSYSGTPPTVASLQATGTGIKWYAASSGGSPLSTSTNLVHGNHYYASQVVDGCESTTRFDVIAAVDLTPCAPTGNAAQTYSPGATVASLAATGSSIRWYDVSSGGSALPVSTVLVNGNHYWATQTLSCTESASRFEVTVTISGGPY